MRQQERTTPPPASLVPLPLQGRPKKEDIMTDLDTFITAIAPTFETHINVPLNHRGVYNLKDPVGMADVVDLTLGANIQFGQRTLLLLGAVTPVSGPRPFAIEGTALLNIYFGGRRVPPITPSYPMAGM